MYTGRKVSKYCLETQCEDSHRSIDGLTIKTKIYCLTCLPSSNISIILENFAALLKDVPYHTK